MSSRTLKAAVAVAIAAAFSLTATPAQAAPDPADSVWFDLGETYAATGIYAYEPFAIDDGYLRPMPPDDCVPEMGYHNVNFALVDGKVDVREPEAILYEARPDGTRELVAVEWAVPIEATPSAPKLFGKAFSKDEELGLYTLHAWIYKDNPDGLFTAFNPTVKCPAP
jgi:hypothetical protein